jgi:hypothetical protein
MACGATKKSGAGASSGGATSDSQSVVFFMSPDVEPTNNAALDQSQSVEDMRTVRWQCGKCGHVMDFTRPVAVIVCEQCPKCQGEAFNPA